MQQILNDIEHDLRGNKYSGWIDASGEECWKHDFAVFCREHCDIDAVRYIGSGEPSGDDCGKLVFVRVCTEHGEFSSVYHNCKSFRCPICGRKTLWKRSARKSGKVSGYRRSYAMSVEYKQSVMDPVTDEEQRYLQHLRRGVSHAVLSVPAGRKIRTDTLLANVRRFIPDFAGIAVEHVERINKKGVLRRARKLGHDTSQGAWSVVLDHMEDYADMRIPGQHVHLVGYIPVVNTRALYDTTGYTFKRIRKELDDETVTSTLYYLGTHSPIDLNKERQTIFHEIGLQNVETAEETVWEEDRCPICGKHLIERNVETGEERPAMVKRTAYRYRWREKDAPWTEPRILH